MLNIWGTKLKKNLTVSLTTLLYTSKIRPPQPAPCLFLLIYFCDRGVHCLCMGLAYRIHLGRSRPHHRPCAAKENPLSSVCRGHTHQGHIEIVPIFFTIFLKLCYLKVTTTHCSLIVLLRFLEMPLVPCKPCTVYSQSKETFCRDFFMSINWKAK